VVGTCAEGCKTKQSDSLETSTVSKPERESMEKTEREWSRQKVNVQECLHITFVSVMERMFKPST